MRKRLISMNGCFGFWFGKFMRRAVGVLAGGSFLILVGVIYFMVLI